MADWVIERLHDRHDRSEFDCGHPTLNGFLSRLAGQYDRKDFARTYVAFAPPEERVAGYYSLSAGAINLAVLPEEARKKLPRHPVPVAHLGRLAVATSSQGKRLGETLLLDAMRRTVRLSAELAIHAIEVFAIDEAAKRFYLKYGFFTLPDDPFHLYLPMKTIRSLKLG
jgi:GNAT superfamily N-acetyltransferase